MVVPGVFLGCPLSHLEVYACMECQIVLQAKPHLAGSGGLLLQDIYDCM